MEIQNFRANGKLMLFGEYLVLKGTPCLAIPLKKGQSLEVSTQSQDRITWKAYQNDDCWLEIYFSNDLDILSTNNESLAKTVQQILVFIQEKKPKLKVANLFFKFLVDFNREFGFGTSSTLISLLSDWSGVPPYELLENTFGGSGYDVAGAKATSAYFYTIDNRLEGYWSFPKEISKHLLFIYLGKKQKSDKSVAQFNTKPVHSKDIYFMNFIMDKVFQAKSIEEWEDCMMKSEDLLTKILGLPKVKDIYFSDYPHAIKSLGAWGGDFIMATFRDKTAAKKYFQEKGFQIIYDYEELSLA